MKKSLLIAFFVGLGMLFVPAASVFAQGVGGQAGNNLCPPGRFASLCSLKVTNASSIVSTILTILLIVAMIVAVFFMIFGGIRWIMSGGDKGKIDQARQTLTAALVGLIIALLAFFIVSIVSFVLTGQAGFNFAIPTLAP